MLLAPLSLSSSELEDVVLEEDLHFLFMVTGTLQLSKYLQTRQHTVDYYQLIFCNSITKEEKI